MKKLKNFDFSQTSQRRGDPVLGVNKKTGACRLSKKAAELIGLQAGDRINFSQDPDEPADWYLSKAKKDEGVQLRVNNTASQGGSLLFNSANFVEAILNSIEFKENTGSMKIADESEQIGGVEVWPVITRSIKINYRGRN